MTKLRAPDSIEDAVRQAIALLGDETIAMALSTRVRSISASMVRKWSDPERERHIPLADAVAIETLLIKTGHAPIFADLFVRLQPGEPEGDPEHPLAATIRTNVEAAQLMDRVDRAMADGELQSYELIAIRASVDALMRRAAKLKRTLFYRRERRR